ncbi:MAG: PLP-dependent aminotransferase family protein [Bacteroidales bacterium]|nr:PLP-dependent aminotransferase family protein [Bacteroidales bacterium]
MDYSRFFSDDVPSFLRSPVREIFRKVDLASIYSFAGGYPDASTFPLAEMEGLTRRVVEKYGARALQYGGTQGVTELREIISRRYDVPLERVQITTSSQQGIDVCARVFLNPGDVVLTTYPAYLGALQSFRAYRAAVHRLPLEDLSTPGQGQGEGPIADGRGRSERSERSSDSGSTVYRRAKLIYIVPDFCNPSGVTMSPEERQALVEFARREDLLIVEDSPYRELRYSGTDIPTIYSLAPERTLHLGSFSKIFAPGFRLGWIIAEPALLEQIFVCKQALDLCPPVFDQYLAAEFMGSGALDRNLKRSISLYRDKRDYMVSLLEKYMPTGVSWTHPDGGLFLWVTLPEGIDTVAMYDSALAAGVAYVAGSFFFPDGSHRNTMRLNFSYLAKERMEAGVHLLAAEINRAVSCSSQHVNSQ